jgi:hypothetical protein
MGHFDWFRSIGLCFEKNDQMFDGDLREDFRDRKHVAGSVAHANERSLFVIQLS